ncbi:MAG: divergent polysaccharide deacetylase family protein, partial [Candidatus Cloacimonadia bacterium]
AEDVSQKGYAEKMSEKILQYAKTHNEIVVITHCRKSSLNSLTEILEKLKNTDVRLVPLSEIVLPKEYVL